MHDHLEIVNVEYPRGPFRAAVFDFDGTLSLLRRNWQDVMIPMMVDVLVGTGTDEPRERLDAHVEEFVMRLNGRQTIYQMIQLADEVRRRGGAPLDPLEYKHQYHELLWRQVSQRVEAVASGRVSAETMTVPGARALLEVLKERGVELYLASGTDLNYVQDEARTLGLAEFFEPRIYGALDDYRQFSKAMIIERIIGEASRKGSEIVAFGDGFVEIEEVKKVGGLAVGVASDEVHRQGVNSWKRERLITAGADWIIPDYHERDSILERLSFAD